MNQLQTVILVFSCHCLILWGRNISGQKWFW